MVLYQLSYTRNTARSSDATIIVTGPRTSRQAASLERFCETRDVDSPTNPNFPSTFRNDVSAVLLALSNSLFGNELRQNEPIIHR